MRRKKFRCLYSVRLVSEAAIVRTAPYRYFYSMRLVTPFLWLFVTLVLTFDAVGQPCDLRAELVADSHHVSGEDMPCHDMMMTADMTEHNETPQYHKESCCCAALPTTVISFYPADFKQPLPGVLAWDAPLNDRADSLPFEYEPPPPRA